MNVGNSRKTSVTSDKNNSSTASYISLCIIYKIRKTCMSICATKSLDQKFVNVEDPTDMQILKEQKGP